MQSLSGELGREASRGLPPREGRERRLGRGKLKGRALLLRSFRPQQPEGRELGALLYGEIFPGSFPSLHSHPNPAGAYREKKNVRVAAQSCRRILTSRSRGETEGSRAGNRSLLCLHSRARALRPLLRTPAPHCLPCAARAPAPGRTRPRTLAPPAARPDKRQKPRVVPSPRPLGAEPSRAPSGACEPGFASDAAPWPQTSGSAETPGPGHLGAEDAFRRPPAEGAGGLGVSR